MNKFVFVYGRYAVDHLTFELEISKEDFKELVNNDIQNFKKETKDYEYFLTTDLLTLLTEHHKKTYNIYFLEEWFEDNQFIKNN
jgi:hypothetical protein